MLGALLHFGTYGDSISICFRQTPQVREKLLTETFQKSDIEGENSLRLAQALILVSKLAGISYRHSFLAACSRQSGPRIEDNVDIAGLSRHI
jgi:hypothetical protein